MTKQFSHLHVHSEYSIVNSTLSIKSIVSAAVANSQTAIAITDQFNLFATVKFYKEALSQGIKPIIGSEVAIFDSETNAISRLVLLVQNEIGFKNLKILISRSFVNGQKNQSPTVDKSWLDLDSCSGLIALSAGVQGDIGISVLKGDLVSAQLQAEAWKNIFGDRFYLELIRTNRPGESLVNAQSVELSKLLKIPIMASNDAHFLSAADFESHEARVCINEGTVLANNKRNKLFSEFQYLRDSNEMHDLFSDAPEAIFNANELVKRCNLVLNFGDPCLPKYPVPPGMTTAEFFSEESFRGLNERLLELFSDSVELENNRPKYEARLSEELKVINTMGFAGYFLIVADFIAWSREKSIPVGPGRGSGAGSLVAYSLKITNIDPLEYDLLFERFLNPERVSMPDFDIDFCMDRRGEVIQYVADKYGKDRVSQIITYGSMNAKGVIRDVGRVLSYPYGLVDGISKLIPFDLKMTLRKALVESSDLKKRYESENDVKEMVDLAMSLEGLKRNVGKHAAGLVISPTDINDFTPVYCEDNDTEIVSQFDKDDVETVGLVKFDFLGLRTLTVIDWALNNITKTNPDINIDIDAIDLNDPKVYKILQEGNTKAVFQMESTGLQEMLKKLKPSEFEDIIAAVALYRPGPLDMGMDQTFIDRKHGVEEVSYPHMDLEEILKPTYGVIVYQEQVMQIAQVLAGYSLGGADILRRAMGKKKAEEMAEQRSIFTEGAIARGVDEKVATSVFDLMETFASYGFNKSHSAAYALIAYQTAWLKTYYPAAFMASVLSSDMDSTNKVVGFIAESRRLGLEVLPPDVNYSLHEFSSRNDQQVIYGLGAIKGVGIAAIENIILQRQPEPYQNLYDFCKKTDSSKVNKRVIEALIRAGALDSLLPVNDNLNKHWDYRSTLVKNIPAAIKFAEQEQSDLNSGQVDLFSLDLEESEKRFTYSEELPWSENDRLYGERDTLGLFLTGHPIDQFEDELSNFVSHKLANLDGKFPKVCVAGFLLSKQIRETKTGKVMAILTLDDGSSQTEIVIFSEKYQEYSEVLLKDDLLVITGNTREDFYRGGFSLQVDEIFDIGTARREYAKYIEISYRECNSPQAIELKQELQEFVVDNSGCYVKIVYQTESEIVDIWLNTRKWMVTPDDSMINSLKKTSWIDSVRVVYK